MYLQVGTEDEDGLIGRCLDGDSAAFEPLVERYHRPLFRVAARLLGDREEARDATQTAFLKAYQALATCDRQRKFFSWIYRILVNECLNTLRARRPMQGLDGSMAAPAGRGRRRRIRRDAEPGAAGAPPTDAGAARRHRAAGTSRSCGTSRWRRRWGSRRRRSNRDCSARASGCASCWRAKGFRQDDVGSRRPPAHTESTSTAS